MNIFKDIAPDFIINISQDFIKQILEKKADDDAWKKLFEETGQFIKDFENRSGDFYNLLNDAFSEENLRCIAGTVQSNDGTVLVNEICSGVKKILNEYNFTYDEKEYIASTFVQIVLEWIKINRAEVYTQYQLKNYYENLEHRLQNISQKIDTLEELCGSLSSRHVEAYTIDQIEHELRESTENHCISIDFFEVDDDDFIKEFDAKLKELGKSGTIYVKGRGKEETTYCVLNHIRDIAYDRNTIVIRKFDEWEKLRHEVLENKETMSNSIVIPDFFAEQIAPIPNNITVFIYSAEDNTSGKSVIVLKPRTKKTIQKSLERAGMSPTDAYDIVHETHGLYALLKKRVFTSQFRGKPEWVQITDSWIVRLLMCGQWTDAEEDMRIIEELTDISYSDLEKKMELLTEGEEPFVVSYRKYGRKYWRIAGYENVWSYIGDRISVNDDFWKKYAQCIVGQITTENLLRRVINGDANRIKDTEGYVDRSGNSDDNIFDGKNKNKIIDKINCSNELKEGMLKALIFIATYNPDKAEYQYAVDKIVKDILDTIKDRNLWCDIAPFFSQLCEASPEKVLQKVEGEFDSPSGFLDFFGGEDKRPFLGQTQYTRLIFGLEQFLVQERYAVRAINIFAKLNGLQMDHVYVNSPEETLGNVFCPWMNITAIPQDKKAQLLDRLVREYPDCWKIAYSGLPDRKTIISGGFVTPKFRDYAEIEKPKWSEVDKAQHDYWKICVNYAGDDADRWTMLIDEAEQFDKQEIAVFFFKLNKKIISGNEFDELEKTKIKNHIRQRIYRHRFFRSSFWAIGEDKLEVYINAYDRIKLGVPEYEYIYLSHPTFSFPLLNPAPMTEDDYHEQNKSQMEDEIKGRFEVFKQNSLDLFVFLRGCQICDYSGYEVGERIFKFYSDCEFDDSVFKKMIAEDAFQKYALGYAESAVRSNLDNIPQIIDIVENTNIDESIVVNYYTFAPIDDAILNRIDAKSDKFKDLYWDRSRPYDPSGKFTDRILKELYDHGTMGALLRFIFSIKSSFEPKRIIELLNKMFKSGLKNPDATSRGILEDLLNIVQKEYMADVGSGEFKDVISLEIAAYFCGLIAWDCMKCLRTDLEHTPDNYVEILHELFLKDSQRRKQDEYDSVKEASNEEQQKAKMLYSLYSDLVFCPGVKDGVVDETLLKAWVEKFREQLSDNDQMSKFTMSLGKLFAYSPEDSDGYRPAIPIREMIEDYGDEALERAYVTSIYNQRGVYTLSAGKAEEKLAKGYRDSAKYFMNSWTKTSKIFYRLSDIYENESREEREVAVYGDY